jgi:hypothetical protein
MNKLFLSALACLAILVPAGKAVQLSDLSPTLTRTEADDNLTKDYAYRVLSDLSIRRIWNLDENRKLSIDFDGKTGKLICIVVDYRVPVALEDADRDAADIGKFDNAAWRKFDANKAAKYYMDRSRAMKFDSGYMFQELSGANKCLRLTFYPKTPKENRRHLSEGSTASATSALGSSLSGSAVKTLLQDEETRLYTPNKTDKAKEKPAPKPVIIEEDEPEETPEEEPEIVEEEPEAVDETVEETVQTGVVVKGPVKVKPIKTVKKKGDRSSDAGSFLAKMVLDGLKPIHWILICVGLVVLISIIGAISRSNERRRLEQRAARLRNSEGLSLGGRKGDNSKLRIK